jgi:hypothetical protein
VPILPVGESKVPLKLTLRLCGSWARSEALLAVGKLPWANREEVAVVPEIDRLVLIRRDGGFDPEASGKEVVRWLLFKDGLRRSDRDEEEGL